MKCTNPLFKPRDYVQTKEGLMFAVVNTDLIAADLIVSCLRYIHNADSLSKISTTDANRYLQANYPQYLHYLEQFDTVVHAVPLAAVKRHYQPVERLKQICQQPNNALEQLTSDLCAYVVSQGLDADHLGVSGSILIAAHGAESDIDLVVYGRDNFFKARDCLQQLFCCDLSNSKHTQHHQIQPLSQEQWRQSWNRRGCDLSLEDYIWHEQRKYNKASINGIKFDLTMVETQITDHQVYVKQGTSILNAVIIDDSKAYDYPVRYRIDHPQIEQILSYSATYAGQACNGEQIEAKGVLEKSDSGDCRLVVGTSREAAGEYLKVLR
jgi:predicted nucleotidyltransferase